MNPDDEEQQAETRFRSRMQILVAIFAIAFWVVAFMVTKRYMGW